MEEITELTVNQELENDMSIQRSVTMPILLFRLCKKYGISRSEALEQGALMLLRQNDAFMDSDANLERAYREKPSKYADKVASFTAIIRKLTEGK